jgi:hypothetical protein
MNNKSPDVERKQISRLKVGSEQERKDHNHHHKGNHQRKSGKLDVFLLFKNHVNDSKRY